MVTPGLDAAEEKAKSLQEANQDEEKTIFSMTSIFVVIAIVVPFFLGLAFC